MKSAHAFSNLKKFTLNEHPANLQFKSVKKTRKKLEPKTLLVELLSDSVVFKLRDVKRIDNAKGGRGSGALAGIGAILHNFQQQAHRAVHRVLVDYGGFHCNLFSVLEIESNRRNKLEREREIT